MCVASMKTILVTGDFLIDHHIYQGTRHHFDDQSCPGVCVAEELGGAALIHRLLQAMPTSLEAPWTSVLGIDESTALNWPFHARTRMDDARTARALGTTPKGS